ncbi:BBT_HP_G0053820.mRNA.1.CDS.1 [Saccharomyces cerevisiae]|nr:BBT_HP_G0053820.mRNA.1.CDS.1 [Saccharomyces cerevisiae]CAI6696317.1 BBT_HP_G0053820.mRNA.1.CDS.1 [Saccharomyces cerevisiae]
MAGTVITILRGTNEPEAKKMTLDDRLYKTNGASKKSFESPSSGSLESQFEIQQNNNTNWQI